MKSLYTLNKVLIKTLIRYSFRILIYFKYKLKSYLNESPKNA